MTRFVMRGLVAAVFAALIAGAARAEAADSPIGTWLKKDEKGKTSMTMTIEAWGSGKAKLTYHIKDPPVVLTIASGLDGNEVPVLMNGKPSGETMAIKMVDPLHSFTVL
jgi:nitrous oxide reductase accessory protein NosL